MNDTAFIPIPDCPGYVVDGLGRIRSEATGRMLRCDPQGRVMLHLSDRRQKVHTGELLLRARGGACRPASRKKGLASPNTDKPAPADPDAGRRDADGHDADGRTTDALRERLVLARRVNGHLLALVAKLRAHAERLQASRNFPGTGTSS